MICFPWERREMSLNSLSAYPTFPSFLSLAFVFRERMCTQTFIHFLNCRRCSFLPICWRCFVNLLYSEVLFIILYFCNLPCFHVLFPLFAEVWGIELWHNMRKICYGALIPLATKLASPANQNFGQGTSHKEKDTAKLDYFCLLLLLSPTLSQIITLS